MKKAIIFFAIIITALSILPAQGARGAYLKEEAGSFVFTDASGRKVEIPEGITKVAPSGAVATMFLTPIAPEYMCNVNSAPSVSQMAYLPKAIADLPATGQLYGSKATLNLEELIATGAQIMIDIGDYKDGIEDDLDNLQAQIGIPCIFLRGDLESMADTYRSLGRLLEGKEEKGEELASFIDRTIAMTAQNRAKVRSEDVKRVMLTSGPDGLGTYAKGSAQAQVLDLIGTENAIVVENVTSKGVGNAINIEQLYAFDPDYILFSPDSIYDKAASDPQWKELRAIREGSYAEIPGRPYNWMANPPSINMVLGIWWAGNLIYPEHFDYDVAEAAKEFYNIFWDYELTDAEAESMLSRSTLR